ncbi:ABC transporter permease [Pontivivens ytuae]|uniref:ABC transporter permease n=1 Tax=Pontivivens ytuae TaxID=2789856 RepID=A0A7S9LS02_9RHOB|nr:ABC transporter permease [Pontivivens ytuae]QPH54226.1 ABC transporter permease [Pontivivens ytuae]
MTDARNPLIFAASLLALVLVWQVAAVLTADPLVLPSPLRVAEILWGEAVSGTLWRHMVPTLLRVAAAFTLAMVLGSALGLVLGLMPRMNRWADPWVVVFLNMPALVVIVLCYLWIGLNETAAIVAVAANKAAAVLVTVREGARALDPAVAEMARVYRMSPLTRLRHVILPQLAPFFAAAARGGLSIIWKLVLVVELLGRPNGIGFQIHLYFQLFEVGYVLAYALSFIGVMLLIEYALIQPAEQRASRWRRRIA